MNVGLWTLKARGILPALAIAGLVLGVTASSVMLTVGGWLMLLEFLQW